MAGGERYEWVVPPEEERVRLDRFLARSGELGTRSQVHRLIDGGFVHIDGRAGKPGSRLHSGQRVTAEKPPCKSPSVEPEPIELDVLYEDDGVLVINKPPGLVVHPAPGHWTGTLVNALLYRWRRPPRGLDPFRLGIVHRLDKNTSGVLVVAKNPETLAHLGGQFRRREVQKQYLALAWGRFRRRLGTVAEPIGRHPVHRKRMAVRPRGRAATTHYEVLEVLGDLSVVRLRPETGRTHQIRVHLAALGHPIYCDPDYSRGHRAGCPALMNRQALHAESIRFHNPATDEPLRVSAPLSGDFAQALENLRRPRLTSAKGFTSAKRENTQWSCDTDHTDPAMPGPPIPNSDPKVQ